MLEAQGNLDDALRDFSEAIRLRPDFMDAYYNRALVRRKKADNSAAIADLQAYLDLGGGRRDGDQTEVERQIDELKKKL